MLPAERDDKVTLEYRIKILSHANMKLLFQMVLGLGQPLPGRVLAAAVWNGYSEIGIFVAPPLLWLQT